MTVKKKSYDFPVLYHYLDQKMTVYRSSMSKSFLVTFIYRLYFTLPAPPHSLPPAPIESHVAAAVGSW